MPFDFEADRVNAEMYGYEPAGYEAAGSSLPMLLRCGARQRGDAPFVHELRAVESFESVASTPGETIPIADSGALPDARQLVDDGPIWGG